MIGGDACHTPERMKKKNLRRKTVHSISLVSQLQRVERDITCDCHDRSICLFLHSSTLLPPETVMIVAEEHH